MKKSATARIILSTFFILFAVILFAQVDSSGYEGKAGVADVAEEDTGLFMLMMFMLMGAVAAVLACLLVGLLIMGIIFLIIMAGIASISAFLAWYRKSVYEGVRWFLYLTFAVIGIAGGIVGGVLIKFVIGYHASIRSLLPWTVPAGLVGGLIAAWALIKIGNIIYQRVLNMRAKMPAQ